MGKIAVKKKGKFRPKKVKKLTRKELRKQKVEQKKEHKRLYFSNKTQGDGEQLSVTGKGKVRKDQQQRQPPKKRKNAGTNDDDDESIASDFSDAEVDARLKPAVTSTKMQQHPNVKRAKMVTAPRPDVAETRRRELRLQHSLEASSRKQRVKQLKLENEEEDLMIARLEKRLKLNRTKDKNRLVRKMFNDGLDYALEFCLDDDEERDKRALKERRKQEQQRSGNAWSDDEGEDFGDDVGESGGSDEDAEENDDILGGASDSDGDDDDNEEEGSEAEEKPKYTEDIYGRKRDKDGNIIEDKSEKEELTSQQSISEQKYVPPHQRAALAANGGEKEAALVERLRRNCKGLLNRLSEANLHRIATGIEALYMRNARNHMNATLAKLLDEALLGRTLASERQVQEHTVLLAYLHAHIGSEIGAHFLQTFVEQFDSLVNELDALAVEDKRLNNVVLVLSYLYLFKIYEHRLLLELVERLAQQLNEKAIECLLLILQAVGFQLRRDDPLAFKQLLLNVQQRVAAASLELQENVRLHFLVDVLSAVKNNNVHKLPHFDPTLAERLRKLLKAMLRPEKYVVTLNIAMADLLRADQVGKWWVVGSAWRGNVNEMAAAAHAKSSSEAGADAQPRFSEQLLTLAKEQQMNTVERRNVFCIVMGAEDYVDAFERILHLALKDHRTVADVTLHCSLSERRTNLYYAHLALKFCHHHRRFQLAFQFACWDRLQQLNTLGNQPIRNLARFLRHLVLHGGLQLAVLKVLDFVQLNKATVLLLQELLVGLLLSDDESAALGAFERLARNVKLQTLKTSIRLFVQHFLQRQEGSQLKLQLDETQLELLQKRVEVADRLLAFVDL